MVLLCYCNRHLKTKTKSFLLQYPSLVAQRLKRLTAMWETWVRSLGQEDSPGEGNGNPLQYSCLENPMDGGVQWAIVHGVAKSRTRLSDFTFHFLGFFHSWPRTKAGVILASSFSHQILCLKYFYNLSTQLLIVLPQLKHLYVLSGSQHQPSKQFSASSLRLSIPSNTLLHR